MSNFIKSSAPRVFWPALGLTAIPALGFEDGFVSDVVGVVISSKARSKPKGKRSRRDRFLLRSEKVFGGCCIPDKGMCPLADHAGLFVGLVLRQSCFARMGFEKWGLQNESPDHDWIGQIRSKTFVVLGGVRVIL